MGNQIGDLDSVGVWMEICAIRFYGRVWCCKRSNSDAFPAEYSTGTEAGSGEFRS